MRDFFKNGDTLFYVFWLLIGAVAFLMSRLRIETLQKTSQTLSLVGAIALFGGALWVFGAQNAIAAIFASGMISIAVPLAWYGFRGHLPEHRKGMSRALKFGVFFGGIGFVGGFFGPLIFSPTSNQGPLLGIFFTGPIGFVFGILIGTLYHFLFHQRHD